MIFSLPEVLNSGGLALEQAFEVQARLGLVEEDDLHVNVVPGRVEEVGLQDENKLDRLSAQK